MGVTKTIERYITGFVMLMYHVSTVIIVTGLMLIHFVYTITIVIGVMFMASITKHTLIFVIRFQRQILKMLARMLTQHVIVTP